MVLEFSHSNDSKGKTERRYFCPQTSCVASPQTFPGKTWEKVCRWKSSYLNTSTTKQPWITIRGSCWTFVNIWPCFTEKISPNNYFGWDTLKIIGITSTEYRLCENPNLNKFLCIGVPEGACICTLSGLAGPCGVTLGWPWTSITAYNIAYSQTWWYLILCTHINI